MGAPSAFPVTEPPRHPAPRLERRERLEALAWLWAAVGPECPPPPAPPPALWRDLPTLAEGHGLAALALTAARAGTTGLDGQALEGLARLEDAAARTVARGRRLAEEQAALDAALDRAELPGVWLKGSWLSGEAVYPDPLLRPRADLDLYLPEARWGRAATVLEGLGYRPAQRSWKHAVWLSADHQVVDLRGEHPANPRPVELHPHLGEGFRGLRLDLDADAPRPPARRLSPGVALTHLAAHATVSMLERRLRLLQLLDLALLGRRLAPADEATAATIGSRPGAARFLWPSLALTARLSPSPALQRLVAALETGVAAPLRRWLDAQDLDLLSWPGRGDARRPLLEIPAIWPTGAAEQATVWRAILAPPPELLADRYPELAAEGRRKAMVLRHLGFTIRQAAYRWRQRPR